MARGVPVISSDAGGLPEAHMGVEYTIPVNIIQRYKPAVDANMVPVAEVPPQNIEPWHEALERLLNDKQHWEYVSRRSREAALKYARNLTVEPFENLLIGLLRKPKKAPPTAGLSEEKRKLLALRLRKKAPAGSNIWLSEEPAPGKRSLFCFPWAGGGTIGYRGWDAVAIRLPGREVRIAERPFDRMEDLIPALGEALLPVLRGRMFAFFGHSMGAGIAFELTRWLRDRGEALPSTLIVSAARAPAFRIGLQPAPEPGDEALLQQVCVPREVRENPAALDLLMPALRADTRLHRNWVYKPTSPLDIPVFAYGGADDPNVRPEHLIEWKRETTSTFIHRQFRGGHFYLNEEVIRSVQADLAMAPAAAR
jgi:surfactin synthase thioesterase subunit